jgi:hypothetical protein
MRGIDGVYRRLRHRKKCRQTIKHEYFLRHRLQQTPGEEIAKRRKKDNLSLAIGEKCINKNASFLLTFYL